MRRRAGRPRSRTASGDDGQISLLTLGYTIVALALVAVVTDATAVHLARTQLLDAADAAALDAADAIAAGPTYTGGLGGRGDGGDGADGGGVPVTDAAVREQAARYLATYQPPSHLDAVELAPGTGTTDGHSATVHLVGRVRLPVAATLVASLGGPVTVSVQSTARAALQPSG